FRSQIAYTASKGGVLAMTRELAVEYARRGIRANVLCPGPIDTPLMAELMSDPQWAARRLVHIPMGRPGQAEEIARAALFLACDDSSFMTGAPLVVDGGITAAYVTPEYQGERSAAGWCSPNYVHASAPPTHTTYSSPLRPPRT